MTQKQLAWINTFDNIRSMKRTLDKLVAQANKWEMDFNGYKYGVIHIGKKFTVSQMNDGWDKSIDKERDLEVLMSKDLKFSKQCVLAKK